MQPQPHSVERTLFACARASAHFAQSCFEPYGEHLRAYSSFVTPEGEAMHWHDFGDLEGPGWAANAVGGARLLYLWAAYTGDAALQAKALALLDHVLADGFVDESTGFIWPYFDLAQGRYCLNYRHNNDWLCPGSLAKVGVQLLDFADDLAHADRARADRMRAAARRLGAWLHAHVPLLENGWVPRRITLDGTAYPLSPEGRPDPIFDHSADGLFLLQLWTALTSHELADYGAEASALGETFVRAGGFAGSINHDTYDDRENVAYATAFRVLREAAGLLHRPDWRAFAYEVALPELARFQMHEDRNGVATAGLLWMEKTWNTSYMWENAEAALAFLEAWAETGETSHRDTAVSILSAIGYHYHGDKGFLTEGVDWDNVVSRRHHAREALYGDIQYTEPLLNNMHLIQPILFYLERVGFKPPADLDDASSIALVTSLTESVRPPTPGKDGVRYLLRLYYPALATDERLGQALNVAQRAGVDGVLLFESSFDIDPSLLTLDQLKPRFARLKAVAPRFRALGMEIHINVMITLGHVGGGNTRPERFDFQFQVDDAGNVSESTTCPLDPKFRAHTAELYRMAAECGAEVIWVDDDVRFWGHDVSGLTCFCPLHLAAMEARTGQKWTREALAAALRDDNADPAIRAAWFDLQEDTMLRLAHAIEQVVHGVDPSIRMGLMTIGTSYHALEGRHTDRLLRALSSNTPPLIRPGSGFWHDWQPAAVVDKTEDCARQISFLNEDVQAVAEVENHPYTPFGKSERVLALELALNVLAGMPDLSLNLLSSMDGSGPLEPEGTDFAAFLKARRPFLDALAREAAGRLRRGVGVAISENYARVMPLRGKPPVTGWLEPRPWEPLLARLGLPIGRPDRGPHLLAGEGVRALRKSLGQYFEDGVVLDPTAASALIEMGWSERLGLRAVHPVSDGVNERLSDDPLNGGRAGVALPVRSHVPIDQLYTFDLEPSGTRVLSRWVNVDGKDRGIAAAAVAVPGGLRVGFLPFAVRSALPVLLNVAHREQWSALFEWVSRRKLPCRVVSGANLYPLALANPGDRSWLIAIANLSADDVTAAEVDVSGTGDSSWSAEQLDESGQWLPAPTIEDDRLRTAVGAYSLAVFRLLPRRSSIPTCAI